MDFLSIQKAAKETHLYCVITGILRGGVVTVSIHNSNGQLQEIQEEVEVKKPSELNIFLVIP